MESIGRLAGGVAHDFNNMLSITGMNGRIKAIRPKMKVLFMSGYTSDIVAQRGVIEKGTHYIQKPFSVTKLNEKIQQVLGVGKI